MNFNKLKNIKDFSLLIIPSHQGIQTKSHKFDVFKIILYLSGYTFFIFVIILLLLLVTPAGNILLLKNEASLRSQNEKIDALNKKVLLLTGELENISVLNKKLKNAISIGDSGLAKRLEKPNGSSKKGQKESLLGGNLITVINRIFYLSAHQKDEKIYFLKPVGSAFISRGFNAERGHMGIDFAVKAGTPVAAAASGYVIFAGYTAEDGFMLILMHSQEYISVYKHCSVLTKKVRDKVIQGEVIAFSGNTGMETTGPHLHFELWQDGQVIDPKGFLTN